MDHDGSRDQMESVNESEAYRNNQIHSHAESKEFEKSILSSGRPDLLGSFIFAIWLDSTSQPILKTRRHGNIARLNQESSPRLQVRKETAGTSDAQEMDRCHLEAGMD